MEMATFSMADPEKSHGFRYLRQCMSVVDGLITEIWFEGSSDLVGWFRFSSETVH